MKKIILILSLFLMLINLSNAITINELVDSYNYSYSSSDFVLVLDEQNIINNILNFSLNINSVNGNYTFYFGGKDNLIETNKIVNKNLIYGNNIVNLSLNLSYFEKNNYSLYLNIYDGGNNMVFRNENLFGFEILNNSNLILNKSQTIDNQNYILLNESSVSSIFLNKIIISKIIPKSPDISIKNISYNKTSGLTIVEIKNIGKANAIGFVINIFDENLSKVKENLISLISINQTINLNYTLQKNLSDIYISIFNSDNSDKNIGNNFLFWPVNLTEICADGIDNDRDEIVDEDCVMEVGYVELEDGDKSLDGGGSSSGSSGGGSSSGKMFEVGEGRLDESKILQVRKSKESKNIGKNLNNNLDLIENISQNLSNQVNKLVKKSNENLENRFNSTPFKASKNYSLENNSNSNNFLKKNKVTISGFLFGIASFIFYLLLA